MFVLLLLGLLGGGKAAAQTGPPASGEPGDRWGWVAKADLTVGLGYFDPAGTDESVALDLRWTFEPDLLPGPQRVQSGIMLDPAGSVYAHAGLDLPLALGRDARWELLPSVAAGVWHQGNGKRLGHPLEFRSGIELRRTFRGGGRLGIYLYHLSNASLGDRNPGVEVLGLGWTRAR